MTRKEIVEGLKLLEDNMVYFDELRNDKGRWIDVHELLFEAIQALSQEPTRDIEKSNFSQDQYLLDTDSAYQIGYEQGHMDAEQKSGKWIDYSDEGFVECPFCGHATNCEDNIDELRYCFYCGACMKDGRTLDEFIEDSKESEEISERNMKMWEEIFKAERGGKE